MPAQPPGRENPNNQQESGSRPIRVFNVDSADAPPFAALEIVGWDSDRGAFRVRRCSLTGRNDLLFNGLTTIPAGMEGQARADLQSVAAFLPEAGQAPIPGSVWGVREGDWFLSPHYPGYVILDTTTATRGFCVVQSQRTNITEFLRVTNTTNPAIDPPLPADWSEGELVFYDVLEEDWVTTTPTTPVYFRDIYGREGQFDADGNPCYAHVTRVGFREGRPVYVGNGACSTTLSPTCTGCTWQCMASPVELNQWAWVLTNDGCSSEECFSCVEWGDAPALTCTEEVAADPEQNVQTVPCSDGGTTTTQGPLCPGSCSWEYDSGTQLWSLTDSDCVGDDCHCFAPTFCPDDDACTTTDCGEIPTNQSGPNCTGTTTTASPDCSTTLNVCSAGCDWYCHPIRGWLNTFNGCSGLCPCSYPTTACTAGCADEHTPCVSIPKSCTGGCRWVWIDPPGFWEGISVGCSETGGVLNCSCDSPRIDGTYCGQEYDTTCYAHGEGDDPCSDRTTTTPGPDCAGTCLWGTSDGANWDSPLRACPGCTCDPPPGSPTDTCSVGESPCLPMPTTTVPPLCDFKSCLWNCSGSSYVLNDSSTGCVEGVCGCPCPEEVFGGACNPGVNVYVASCVPVAEECTTTTTASPDCAGSCLLYCNCVALSCSWETRDGSAFGFDCPGDCCCIPPGPCTVARGNSHAIGTCSDPDNPDCASEGTTTTTTTTTTTSTTTTSSTTTASPLCSANPCQCTCIGGIYTQTGPLCPGGCTCACPGGSCIDGTVVSLNCSTFP